ncbi:MAG: J domain-containing protein [Chloroflexi bacterium]|nr:J domain-containing protein [Chloroflexota bacterium]
MPGLFFSRKSKNGVGEASPPAVAPDDDTLYQPLVTANHVDEPPDAIPGMPDLYAILGVDPRSSDDIIRYAYRKRAAKLVDARWRQGRAARKLSELNAAYEILGKPDRRADYDRQRARLAYYQRTYATAPPVLDGSVSDGAGRGSMASVAAAPHTRRGTRGGRRLPAPNGPILALVILAVIGLALYAAVTMLNMRSLVDLSPILDAGAAAGLPIRPRATAVGTSSNAAATAVPTRAANATAPTLQVVVPPAVVPTATRASVPTSTASAKPTTSTTGSGAIQSSVQLSTQTPSPRSNVTITARFLRDGQPMRGVPVYASVYFKTVEERWPSGGATQPTNERGEAAITFNIGNATPGFEVPVHVVAEIDGQPQVLETAFTPR